VREWALEEETSVANPANEVCSPKLLEKYSKAISVVREWLLVEEATRTELHKAKSVVREWTL